MTSRMSRWRAVRPEPSVVPSGISRTVLPRGRVRVAWVPLPPRGPPCPVRMIHGEASVALRRFQTRVRATRRAVLVFCRTSLIDTVQTFDRTDVRSKGGLDVRRSDVAAYHHALATASGRGGGHPVPRAPRRTGRA